MNLEAHATIRFLVDVDKHCNVKVVGNIDALGQWAPASGLRTRWIKNTLFEAEVTIARKNVPKIIEYKYVSCPENEADIKWEEHVNRILDTSESDFLQVQDYFQTHQSILYTTDPVLVNYDKIFGRTIEPKHVLTPQRDHALIRFQVAAGTIDPKDYILICGNSKALDKVAMQYTYEKWELDVLVPLADFPIEYKYATVLAASAPTYNEEICQPRAIELPSAIHQRVVVQLHDVYRAVSASEYTCFTTPIRHGKRRMWIKQRSKAYLDPSDGKIVVSNLYDLQSALKYLKPFKIRKSSCESLLVSALHADEWELLVDALNDTECSWPKIELREHPDPTLVDLNIERFAQMLSRNKSLADLTVFARALNADKLCLAIGSHQGLKRLTVSDKLELTACEQLGRLLQMTRTIRHLNLTFGASVLIRLYNLLKFNASVCSVAAGVTFVTNQQAEELREVMKHNDTITCLALDLPYVTEPLHKAMEFDDNFFATNWALTEWQIHYSGQADVLSSTTLTYLARNKTYQRDMLAKTIVILYNMARVSKETLGLLPLEVWLHVFSFLRYAGKQQKFDAIFEALLDDTSIRRVI